MFKNISGIVKNVGAIILLFLAIVSCEKDIENIGVDLIDNGAFKVGDTAYDVVAYNVNVPRVRVDNNNLFKVPQYLLGVHRNPNFGYLKSTVVSQVFLPAFGAHFGDKVVIDKVVLDIPYYATKDSMQTAKNPDTGEDIVDEEGNPVKVPSFTLDSVYGNTDVAFQIRVRELETFLNVLDPYDPTKRKEYYSDRDYAKGAELFYGDFKPNRNDTVLYVERRYLDGDPSTIDKIDTIKLEEANPSMKFVLDEQFFKTRFVDQQDQSYFDSNDNFIHYFKGLYIEPEGTDGSWLNFPINKSTMTIYYTAEEIKDEPEGEDLNYNGIPGEENVPVNVNKMMAFKLSGVQTGIYNRDYSGSLAETYLMNPDTENGDRNLFVQGAAGSDALIKLFSPENLEHLRKKEWLINEANLKFYVDRNLQKGKLPDQLFLYDHNKNIILEDLMFTGFEVYGGTLVYDSDGEPDYYKFRITRFLSELLKDTVKTEAPLLELKTYHPTDNVDFKKLDSVVTNYSWIPKGVVLKGNRPATDGRRLKLEIFYSK